MSTVGARTCLLGVFMILCAVWSRDKPESNRLSHSGGNCRDRYYYVVPLNQVIATDFKIRYPYMSSTGSRLANQLKRPGYITEYQNSCPRNNMPIILSTLSVPTCLLTVSKLFCALSAQIILYAVQYVPYNVHMVVFVCIVYGLRMVHVMYLPYMWGMLHCHWDSCVFAPVLIK